MAMTTTQARAFLLGLLPRGIDRVYDFSSGADFDKLLTGAAEQFALRVATPTDAVEADSNPVTLTSTGLAAWEAVLGINGAARSVAQRQAAIIARLREFGGASTLPAIKAILGPILGYANPSQLVIIETDRAALTLAHTYPSTGAVAIVGGGSNAQSAKVGDDPKVSQAGAQIYLDNFSASNYSDVSVVLAGPDATTKTWTNPSRGAQDPLVLYAPEFAGKAINGTWTVTVSSAAGNVNADDWRLIVEGIGWQTVMGGAQGLGAAIFEWAVLVDPALAGVMAPPDYSLALATLRRIKPAHTQAYLVKKMSGGGLCAICDDPNAIADGCVCC